MNEPSRNLKDFDLRPLFRAAGGLLYALRGLDDWNRQCDGAVSTTTVHMFMQAGISAVALEEELRPLGFGDDYPVSQTGGPTEAVVAVNAVWTVSTALRRANVFWKTGEEIAIPDLGQYVQPLEIAVGRLERFVGPEAPVKGSPAVPAQDPPKATHSEDFRSVTWSETPYTFTATQAACVRVLWEAWARGVPDLDQGTVLAKAGSESRRLSNIFKKHPAWKTMITQGETRGTVRLSAPSSQESAK